MLNLRSGVNIFEGMNNGKVTPTGKLIISLVILAVIIVMGTFGFAVIEDMSLIDSLYMTVITMSTVGFGEIRPLHQEGRVFVIFIIILSLTAGTIAASAIGQVIIEGQLRSVLGRRKMRTKIRKLSDHYIIAGFGRVGRQVAEAFVRRRVPFIVIENNHNAINQLEAEGYVYIEGEAIEDDVLQRAGVDRARVLVSTLPTEADNVYLALTARDFNPDLYIICRADNPEGEKKLKRAGANHVVSPHILGGMRMAMASLRPNVVDFMVMSTLGDAGLGIEEIVLPQTSPFVGKTIVESKIKSDYDVTVIGIRRGSEKMIISPSPSEGLRENDILLLIGANENLERFTHEMG